MTAAAIIIAFVSGAICGWVQRGWSTERRRLNPRMLTEEEQCQKLERGLRDVEAEFADIGGDA